MQRQAKEIQYYTPLNIKNKMNQNNEVKQILNNTIFKNSSKMKHLTLHVEKKFCGHGSKPRIVNTETSPGKTVGL